MPGWTGWAGFSESGNVLAVTPAWPGVVVTCSDLELFCLLRSLPPSSPCPGDLPPVCAAVLPGSERVCQPRGTADAGGSTVLSGSETPVSHSSLLLPPAPSPGAGQGRGWAGCCHSHPRRAPGVDVHFQKAEGNHISWSLRLPVLGDALQKWGTEITLPPPRASWCHQVSISPSSGVSPLCWFFAWRRMGTAGL